MKKGERQAIGRLLEAITSSSDPYRAQLAVLRSLAALSETKQKGPSSSGKKSKRSVLSAYGPSDLQDERPYRRFLWQETAKGPRSGKRQKDQGTFHSADSGSLDHGKKLPRLSGKGSVQERLVLQDLAQYLGRGLKNLARWEARVRAAGAWGLLVDRLDEPLVALRCRADGVPFALAAATGGARRILGTTHRTQKNSRFREFLRHAIRAAKHRPGVVIWSASKGQRFRLVALPATKNQRPSLILVRLIRMDTAQPAMPDDHKEALKQGLTEREADVFVCVARGLSNKEIARELGLAYHTVRAHVRNIFERLGVSSRVQAIQAVREGARP